MESPTEPASYVVGFMLDEEHIHVALIRKRRPHWQTGLLNGIGGKVERGEDAIGAMVREFTEETGYITVKTQWAHFCEIAGQNDGAEGPFRVDFFATTGDLTKLRTVGDEQIAILETTSINPRVHGLVANVPWLVALAIGHLRDHRPTFVVATYR